MSPHQRSASERRWTLVFVTVAIATVALRIVGITYNFDGDEIFSVRTASDTWSQVIQRSVRNQPHPPLHNILLHFWINVFGNSEASARALSVVFALGATLVLIQILRHRVRPLVAVCAGLTMALSAFFIYYGQQARPYALISLVGGLNLWTFLRLLERPGDRARILAWAASAALVAYSQYFGAVYLLVEGCILLCLVPRREWVRVLGPAVLAAGLVLPWMWAAFRRGRRLEVIDWIGRPELRGLPDLYLSAIGWPAHVSGYVLLALLTALFAAGVWRLWHSGCERRDAIVLAALAFMPPVLMFFASHTLDVPLWAPRQLITSTFAFIALVAILANTLDARAGTIACLLLVVWAAAGASDGFPERRKPAWLKIMKRIEQNRPDATVLTEEYWTAYPLAYYATTASVVDSVETRKEQALYFVCRPERCASLEAIEKQVGPGTEISRDLWNARGGKLQDVLITYRLPGADGIRQVP